MRRRPLFIVEEDDESGASTRRPPRLGRTRRRSRLGSTPRRVVQFFLFFCVNVFAAVGGWVGSAAVGPCGSALVEIER